MHQECNLQPKIKKRFKQSYVAYYECLDCGVDVCKCGQTFGQHYGTDSKSLSLVRNVRPYTVDWETINKAIELKENGEAPKDIAIEIKKTLPATYKILQRYGKN